MFQSVSLRNLIRQIFIFMLVFTGVMFWGHYVYSHLNGEETLLDLAWERALKDEKPQAFRFYVKTDEQVKALSAQGESQLSELWEYNNPVYHEADLLAKLRDAAQFHDNGHNVKTEFLNNIAEGSVISITNADGKTVRFKIAKKKISGETEDCGDMSAPKKDTALISCMSAGAVYPPSQQYVLEVIKEKPVRPQRRSHKGLKHDRL